MALTCHPGLLHRRTFREIIGELIFSKIVQGFLTLVSGECPKIECPVDVYAHMNGEKSLALIRFSNCWYRCIKRKLNFSKVSFYYLILVLRVWHSGD